MTLAKSSCYTLILFLFASRLEPVFADTTNLLAVADTALRETNPDNNLGGLMFFPAGNNTSRQRHRGLLKFDLVGKIPTNATITSATLKLIVTQGPPQSDAFNLHRVLADWGEGDNVGGPDGAGNIGSLAGPGEATWKARFHPSTLWTISGAAASADYVSTPSATQSVGTTGSTNSFSSPALAADIQAWLNNPGTNFGWILIIADELSSTTARRIGSSEDPANAPTLIVQYTLPSLAISNATRTNNAIQFTFTAEAGNTYVVEASDSLSSGSWPTLTNIAAQLITTEIHVSDPLAPGNRFYRVRTP